MVVQHNLSAMNANRYLGINNSKLSKSLEKLSSGYAINRAGDNAAGLAVSEKMRSQIAGMTQAVKNAQDGISMVQTFEGALTETDSILQRMKTLADQMATGSYQDEVDREAAQLEFDQLNDELDQIADTDFNGVVCLNGGQMADGTKAVEKNGSKVFDYRSGGVGDTTEGADVTANGTDAEHEILENNSYNKAAADKLYEALGIDAKDYGNVNLTFVKNGSNWELKAATTSEFNDDAVEATPATIKEYTFSGTYGGNTVTGTISKADYDAGGGDATTWYLDGNSSTVTATNPGANAAAGVTKTPVYNDDAVDAQPATVKGEVDITSKVKLDGVKAAQVGDGSAANKDDISGDGGLTLTFGDVTLNAVFDAENAKDGDFITFSFSNVADASYAPTNIGVKEDSVKFDNTGVTTGKALTKDKFSATVALDSSIKDDAMTADMKSKLDELNALEFSYDGTDITATGANLLTVATNGTVTDADGNTIATIAVTVDNSELDAADTYTVGFGVKTSAYKVADAADVEAHAITTSDTSKGAMSGGKEPVSESNAFSKGYNNLTYTDHIILQVGARSKDAVDFTFKYNSDGIGALDADMDCSSRGLKTNELSLSTAEDANYAIDRIDSAINKVSMVRATFGAVQNRLEHKIDNLNVSVENLTSAESQIRDTNMPQEMMNFTKQQILAQASQSMLAQANQLPQGVLSLLQ